MSAAEKDAAKAAIGSYLAEYGDEEVNLADLRSYVNDRTGCTFGGPTLATFLKAVGYRKHGYQKIDTCPGRALFYVKDLA